MYQSISEALRRGAPEQALAAAQEALVAAPDDAQAHRWLAAALAANDEPQKALASMDRALALAPDNADLHFQRAGLLLGAGQIHDANAALHRAVGLDPNQFGAYIMQAQLALGRADLDDAERLQRLAARIDPDHVWVRAIEGMVSLRRGDVAGAQRLLSAAAELAPDDPQVRQALGFAYMAAGHHAFAEQAFRGVLEKLPNAHALRGLIAELMRRQGRYTDAAAELEPLLADPQRATSALRRFAGELQLAAGRHELALPLLRSALAAQPRDRRTYNALIEVWRRNRDADDARATLEGAIAAAPDNPDAWRARLAFEPMAAESALEVVGRWLAAMPNHVPAMEAQMAVLGALGRTHEAIDVARRIVERQPGHGPAEVRLIDAKLQEDPAAAIAHIDALLARADAAHRGLLEAWRALALDRAGDHATAAETWLRLQAADAPNRLPLPPLTPPEINFLAAPTETSGPGRHVAFLVGAPGSGVDRVASLLSASILAFRADRFGASPPTDSLGAYTTPAQLRSGALPTTAVVESWQAALPGRGVADGQIIDWLLWWDNALLPVLNEHLPEALVIIAVRDPRDMFLDWLAFGATAPMRMENPVLAAQWLARQLEHLAAVHEQAAQPHALLRLDQGGEDQAQLASALGEALEVELPVPSAGALGPNRFPPGHWRNYQTPLAAPFGVLTPVAVRLGYAES